MSQYPMSDLPSATHTAATTTASPHANDSPYDAQAKFRWDEDDSPAEGRPAPSKKKRRISRSTARRLVRCLVFVSLLLPGAIDYAVQSIQVGSNFNTFPVDSATHIGNVPLLLWSLFLAGSYACFWIIDLVVKWSPKVLLKVVNVINGSLPRHFDIYMDYVTDLRRYIKWFVFLVLLLISFVVIFKPYINNSDSDAWRLVVQNLISTLMVYSLFVVCQKLMIQIVAVRFHRVAYSDRIREINFSSDTIGILYKEAKKILKEKHLYLQHLELKTNRALYKNEPFLKTAHVKWNWKKHHKERRLSGDVTASVHGHKHAATDRPTALLDAPIKKIHRSKSMDERVNEASQDVTSAQSDRNGNITDGSGTGRDSDVEISATSPNEPYSYADGNLEVFETPKRWYSRFLPKNKSAEPEDNRRETGRVPTFMKLAKEINANMDINSSQESRKVAKKIFEAFCLDTATFLSKVRERSIKAYTIDAIHSLVNTSKNSEEVLKLDTFIPLYQSYADALRAFNLFDKDSNGSISKQEMKDTVVSVYQDRKALSSSLRDVGSAVGKLDTMIGTLVAFVAILVGLMIFGVSLGPVLVTSMSFLLAITFMIGNSAKTVFEGIVFLFITHPYDVGDRVFIDGQNLFVKELGIMTTVFERWDGQLIYSPNSQLSTKQITNVRRSPNQMEVVEIHVSMDTPMEKLTALRNRLVEWLQGESKEFNPKMELQPYEIENTQKLKIQLYLEHRSNWQMGDKRWARRNKFYYFLKLLIEELEIAYVPVKQTVQLAHSKQQHQIIR